MPRIPLALEVADLSGFARSLRTTLNALEHRPSHAEMLNLLTKAAGYRNFQHFRADTEGRAPTPVPDAPVLDRRRVEKVARHFDGKGRMVTWPSRTRQQELCAWLLWTRVPAGRVFTERQFSDFLNDWHLFGDAAILRRMMVEMGLVSRTQDGREYIRIEQEPPAELGALLTRLGLRAG
jgi:hypothetical protein